MYGIRRFYVYYTSDFSRHPWVIRVDDVPERQKRIEAFLLFEKAVELVLVTGQASASFLQRRLKLGYARAARIIDQMEHENIVGPSEGSKPREILVDPQSYLKRMEGEG